MTGVIRFGAFELEPQVGILRKHGLRIHLQEQPFRVLLALIEKPGEPVTREELREKVWAGVEFGDFDHRLNIAVNKVREALGDSAETPRFVETLPRRGYRFIAPVEVPSSAAAESTPAPRSAVMPNGIRRAGAALIGLVLIVTAVAAVFLWPSPAPQVQLRRLTNDSSPKYAPVLSDGTRLYFRTAPLRDLNILQVPVSGGEPSRVTLTPPPGQKLWSLLDITPDGQELLLASYIDGEPRGWQLSTVRIVDGATQKFGGLLAREARYSPDGKMLAFTMGGFRTPGLLWVASSDGSRPRQLLELKGLAVTRPCWSPDSARITFGELNRATQESSVWEVLPDGTGLHRVFDSGQPRQPAGWTPDGRLLLLSTPTTVSSSGGTTQYWALQARRFYERGPSRPVQLSYGEPGFAGRASIRDNRTFYDIGTTPLGELQRFDTHSRTWIPHVGGISADAVAYSADGQSVVYATHPQGELWVRRADGSRPVQLTKAPMQAWGGRWSPDGRTIAFVGKSTPDQPLAIYLADAAGGTPRRVCRGECRAGDVAWMPDGKKIVYGIATNRFLSEELYLRVLDVGTGEVTRFPGSEGRLSPRLSPDGSMLAALGADGLWIYGFSHASWKKLDHPGPGGPDWNCWSRDSKSIWYYNLVRGAIMRCRIRDNRHEQVLELPYEEMTGFIGYWFDVTPDDEPMILRRRDVQQIYALDWKLR